MNVTATSEIVLKDMRTSGLFGEIRQIYQFSDWTTTLLKFRYLLLTRSFDTNWTSWYLVTIFHNCIYVPKLQRKKFPDEVFETILLVIFIIFIQTPNSTSRGNCTLFQPISLGILNAVSFRRRKVCIEVRVSTRS